MADEPRRIDARTLTFGGFLGLFAALVPAVGAFGFTVDDALVTARVAHHLAAGLGYRFNSTGPVVDAVTPLGFALVLAPFAGAGVLSAWQWARWLGLGAWLLAAGWLGVAVAGAGQARWRFAGFVPLGCCLPVAAWAGAGMETGLVTALATLAFGRTRWSLAAAGIAGAWRPELVPWVFVLAVGHSWARAAGSERDWRPGLAVDLPLALGPIVGVMVARQLCFGSATPLAALAKPSDLAHGVPYALAALAWTGLPVLLLAPGALRRGDRATQLGALAVGAHFVSLALVGGDWMAFFRLAVPVLPGCVLLAARLAAHAPPWAVVTRAALATAIGLTLFVSRGAEARGVAGHRLRLSADAAPLLADARVVAAADIGWVGATSPATIVDLAGITDPTIAVLAGGHTSKRVGSDLLRTRDVDHVVLLLGPGATVDDPWSAAVFAKAVEARVAVEAQERGFRVEGTVPLGGTNQRYLVVSRPPLE